MDAGIVADGILLLHVAIVAFVLLGEALFLVGGGRGWRWVRVRSLRIVHLVLMVFIAAQAWLGQRCPLTIWEQSLRQRAGQTVYREGFIEHWLSRVLYVDAPEWAFIVAYSLFAWLVLATWHWVPPHKEVQVSRQAGPG